MLLLLYACPCTLFLLVSHTIPYSVAAFYMTQVGKQLTVKTKEQEIEEEWQRCCYLSNRLPGDNIFELRNGPLLKDLREAKDEHIFLPRCVKKARVNPDIPNRWRKNIKKLRRVMSHAVATTSVLTTSSSSRCSSSSHNSSSNSRSRSPAAVATAPTVTLAHSVSHVCGSGRGNSRSSMR